MNLGVVKLTLERHVVEAGDTLGELCLALDITAVLDGDLGGLNNFVTAGIFQGGYFGYFLYEKIWNLS